VLRHRVTCSHRFRLRASRYGGQVGAAGPPSPCCATGSPARIASAFARRATAGKSARQACTCQLGRCRRFITISQNRLNHNVR
jgi:hypothetical protein